MSSESLHEAAEKLSPATIDRHRATVSLMEELEAVDWYDQRIDAATDEELKAVLRHNRDEEKEHAAMVLEWLRRRKPKAAPSPLMLATGAWGSAICARTRRRHESLDARNRAADRRRVES